ncbi:6-cysteine protein [Plasmodium chabaudi adami]|uniref:6-cysteine protein n=1 Tax=Plasmodium chabaudi adami TaxID=5826 RepID=A0A1D3RTL8_PLACE|nr:6-cysteine protein [Plasmodium chabaudi adami]
MGVLGKNKYKPIRCLVWGIGLCLILWSNFLESLNKFNPLLKEEGSLYLKVAYNCEYSGLIELENNYILHYCFFVSDETNGLAFTTFNTLKLKWDLPKEVLLYKNDNIQGYSFITDFITSNLILIYDINNIIKVTVFNNYIEPSVISNKITLNYKMVHKFNIISKVTYFYKNKKSLFMCGMNNSGNIICSFSFDYGLTMKDENMIEFILKDPIPISQYKIDVKFKKHYVYFNLREEKKEISFYEFKCFPDTENSYTCDPLNRILADLQNLKYKYILRTKDSQIVSYQKGNICYIGWSFNSLNINTEIDKQISDTDCFNVSIVQREEHLLVTFRKDAPPGDNAGKEYYTLFEKLIHRESGCELRLDAGSLYVTNIFMENTCNLWVSDLDTKREDDDEVSFIIVVPKSFNVVKNKCFESNNNMNSSIYYLKQHEEEDSNINTFIFTVYKHILIQEIDQNNKCAFENNINKEKIYVVLNMEDYYKTYICDITIENCDLFIYEQSKITISFNKNWIVDEEIKQSNILYNGVYVSLYNILSQTNANNLIEINNNNIVITIPSFIPSTRTIKIAFFRKIGRSDEMNEYEEDDEKSNDEIIQGSGKYSKVSNKETRYVYIRLQKTYKPIKKVLGINFSDTFDIYYKYYKFYKENIKFLVNDFSETNYIGMICQTNKETDVKPCSFTFINDPSQNTSIPISSLIKKPPFLSYFNKNRIQHQNSTEYVSETRFIFPKNFNETLQEKGIKDIHFRCICSTHNGKNEIDTNHEIQYFITTGNISNEDLFEAPRHNTNNTLSTPNQNSRTNNRNNKLAKKMDSLPNNKNKENTKYHYYSGSVNKSKFNFFQFFVGIAILHALVCFL